jgi:hypothetical protein
MPSQVPHERLHTTLKRFSGDCRCPATVNAISEIVITATATPIVAA